MKKNLNHEKESIANGKPPGIDIAMYTEKKEWRTVPYLARRYPPSDDLLRYAGSDYLDIVGTIQDGDVAAPLVRSIDNAEKQVPSDDVYRYPITIYSYGHRTEVHHARGIVYQRHNKGIPILQICDVKLQHGSTHPVKYSWKLVEVTDEECKLEIELPDEGEQVKEIVRFCFAANDTDKLQFRIVDGYDVSYILHTDAIRLRLKLEIALSSPHSALDFINVRGEVNLEIERDGNPYTIHLLTEQHPTKKPKLSLSSNSFEIIRNVPRNLHDCMKLVVKLKDSSGMLIVDACHCIFPYKIPVDLEDYLHFDNGYMIKIKSFWGCCVGVGKGLCTEVCTCEPAEFIGFSQPGEGGCSKDTEEGIA